jgi:hypothetical protein
VVARLLIVARRAVRPSGRARALGAGLPNTADRQGPSSLAWRGGASPESPGDHETNDAEAAWSGNAGDAVVSRPGRRREVRDVRTRT